MRTISGNLDAPPYAGHDFSRSERLLVRLSLFGDATDASVSGRLLGRIGGQQLATLPIAAVAARPGTYQIDLPLQSVAPGDYVIAVAAAKGAQRAEAFVAIRVAG